MRECGVCVCVRGGLGRGHRDGWRDLAQAVPGLSKLWEGPGGTCYPGAFLLEPAPTSGLPERRGGGGLGERETLSGSSPVQQTVQQF